MRDTLYTLVALGLLACGNSDRPQQLATRPNAAPAETATEVPDALPSIKVSLDKVLQHDRDTARKLLGNPAQSSDMMDDWTFGVWDIEVAYDTKTHRAYKFEVYGENAVQKEAAIRSWLGLGPDAIVSIGRQKYEVSVVQNYFVVESQQLLDAAQHQLEDALKQPQRHAWRIRSRPRPSAVRSPDDPA